MSSPDDIFLGAKCILLVHSKHKRILQPFTSCTPTSPSCPSDLIFPQMDHNICSVWTSFALLLSISQLHPTIAFDPTFLKLEPMKMFHYLSPKWSNQYQWFLATIRRASHFSLALSLHWVSTGCSRLSFPLSVRRERSQEGEKTHCLFEH